MGNVVDQLEQPAPCHKCGGRYQVYWTSTGGCRACHGTGTESCPTCDHSGHGAPNCFFGHHSCKDCDGSGFMTCRQKAAAEAEAEAKANVEAAAEVEVVAKRFREERNAALQAVLPVLPPGQTYYFLEEVSKHATNDDCWVVINGQVHDLTAFLNKHPGGEVAILTFAGRDASEEWNLIHEPTVIQKHAPNSIMGRLAEDCWKKVFLRREKKQEVAHP